MAPETKKTVSVIGSLNIDFITRTSRLPEAGETLAALSFDRGFGGKGANQAVACARLAGEHVSVRMIGNIGDDGFGKDYLEALGKEGIDASGVRTLKGETTGVTNIVVEEKTGENRIMFVANANNAFDKAKGEGWDLVDDGIGEAVVFQLEILLDVVLHNMTLARQSNKHVILNPAPAVPLPDSAFKDIDTLIMNETESSILAGHTEQKSSPKDNTSLIALAKSFLSRGVQDAVIITLGEKGLVYATASGTEGHVEAYKATVVDTTAAGDTFVGGYAVQRVRESFEYGQALQFATLAASKTVERSGAMAAIPYLKELRVGLVEESSAAIAASEVRK